MPELRTYKGKHTIAEWWVLAEDAHKKRNKRRLFQQFIRPRDLVFDIGAERGMLTMVFRWMDARVVAVEPLMAVAPQYFPELKWKFMRDPNVKIVAKAVAPTARTAIWVHKGIPYLSSVNRDWMTRSAHSIFYNSKNSRKRMVQAVTLDALIGAFGVPKFIKIDVEGAENMVVKTLTRPVAALSLEFHEDWIPAPALDHLLRLGEYRFNWVRNFTGEYVLAKWVSKAELLDQLSNKLEKKGPMSWGDIYCKRVDGAD